MKMLSKQQILVMIAEEKTRYSSYLQLCSYYKVEPDLVVAAKHLSVIDTLDNILKLM